MQKGGRAGVLYLTLGGGYVGGRYQGQGKRPKEFWRDKQRRGDVDGSAKEEESDGGKMKGEK